MFSGTFLDPAAVVYYLCFLLLAGLVLFVAFKGRRRPRTRARLRRTFVVLALSLLLWLLTLFLEVRTTLPMAQLWLGRANFAAVVFAAYLALRFVREIPARGSTQVPVVFRWLLAETVLLAALTFLTPLVAVAERVEAGRAITTYGLLFPGYLLHVLGYLLAALVFAFREWRRARNRVVRGQMGLVGIGILATGGIAFITNAVLPYGFGDFRFCDLGTFSTLFFALATAYATFINRLFDLRVVLRETLVYGLLLAFVLGAYSSAVFLVTQHVTNGTEKVTQFVVLLIAFSFDPLRRFLEEKTDQLLFGARGADGGRRKREPGRKGGRAGRTLALALLFPWRRQ
jgi:hypothetical protein